MLFAILPFSAFAFRAAADEETTLTIRTSDGLILLVDSAERLTGLREAMEKGPGALDTGGALGALRRAGAPPSGIDLYYSARAGARWKKPVVERIPLEDAVRKGLVPNIIGRDLIEAYILLRANGVDMRLSGEPPAESGIVGGAAVYLHSSMIGVSRSSIMVNGEIFTIAGSGYMLVVLDPEGEKVIAKGEFKTFTDFRPAQDMERFLNGQPEGAIVLGVDFMGPGVFISGGAMDAMRRYGLLAPMDPQIPSSHAFAGRKGLAQGAGAEAYARAQDSVITIFPKTSYMDEADISSLEESVSNISTVIISDTSPASEIVIVR